MALQPSAVPGSKGHVAGVTDMCLLDSLTEDDFIENLRTRFLANHIYVCKHKTSL